MRHVHELADKENPLVSGLCFANHPGTPKAELKGQLRHNVGTNEKPG